MPKTNNNGIGSRNFARIIQHFESVNDSTAVIVDNPDYGTKSKNARVVEFYTLEAALKTSDHFNVTEKNIQEYKKIAYIDVDERENNPASTNNAIQEAGREKSINGKTSITISSNSEAENPEAENPEAENQEKNNVDIDTNNGNAKTTLTIDNTLKILDKSPKSPLPPVGQKSTTDGISTVQSMGSNLLSLNLNLKESDPIDVDVAGNASNKAVGEKQLMMLRCAIEELYSSEKSYNKALKNAIAACSTDSTDDGKLKNAIAACEVKSGHTIKALSDELKVLEVISNSVIAQLPVFDNFETTKENCEKALLAVAEAVNEFCKNTKKFSEAALESFSKFQELYKDKHPLTIKTPGETENPGQIITDGYILGIQRLPRYALLVKEIEKIFNKFPVDSKKRIRLDNALTKIQESSGYMNELQRANGANTSIAQLAVEFEMASAVEGAVTEYNYDRPKQISLKDKQVQTQIMEFAKGRGITRDKKEGLIGEISSQCNISNEEASARFLIAELARLTKPAQIAMHLKKSEKDVDKEQQTLLSNIEGKFTSDKIDENARFTTVRERFETQKEEMTQDQQDQWEIDQYDEHYKNLRKIESTRRDAIRKVIDTQQRVQLAIVLSTCFEGRINKIKNQKNQ